jgi:hypothetical protein
MLTDRTFSELFSDVGAETFEPRTNPRAVVASAATAPGTPRPVGVVPGELPDIDIAPTSSQRSSA